MALGSAILQAMMAWNEYIQVVCMRSIQDVLCQTYIISKKLTVMFEDIGAGEECMFPSCSWGASLEAMRLFFPDGTGEETLAKEAFHGITAIDKALSYTESLIRISKYSIRSILM